jgi:antitoxin ParD1/3/4
MNQLLPMADDIVKEIEDQVESGRFDNAQEVVRAALAVLALEQEQPDVQILQLRAAWDAGLNSGDFAPLDVENIKAAGRSRLSKA